MCQHHLALTGEQRISLLKYMHYEQNYMYIHNVLIQVKDQETCGASWAFSATGALEGQLYKKTRKLTSLSEQQLLDCTVKFGNTGCSGGLATTAYRYLQSSGGICVESSYPYLAYV